METQILDKKVKFDVAGFLIGLETIYPDVKILKKVRILFQSLNVDISLEHDINLYHLSELIQAIDKIDDPFVKNLFNALRDHPNLPWNDALSKGQLLSKIWLTNELKKLNLDLGCVFVCAGWVGILPALMLREKTLQFKKIRSFDIDPLCAGAADSVNKTPYVLDSWKFKASTCDILDINYRLFQYVTKRNDGSEVIIEDCADTIINTSCDHIGEIDKWWSLLPANKLIVVQNNNSNDLDKDHVNTVRGIEDLKKQCPMQKILFEGSIQLPKFDRYMLIGYK